MSGSNSDGRPKTITLTAKESEFLLDNCRVNMAQALQLLQANSEHGRQEFLQKLVDLIENFRAIKIKLDNA